jgi:hypothetical protein
MHTYRRYSKDEIRELRRVVSVLVSADARLKDLRHSSFGARIKAIAAEIEGALRMDAAVKRFEDAPPRLSGLREGELFDGV